ncbi:MAG: glycosyltransferase family 39 protein [Myxococcota bacterium]
MPPTPSRWATLALGVLSLAGAVALIAIFHGEATRYGLEHRLLTYLVAPGPSEPETAFLVFQLLYAVPAVLLLGFALESLAPGPLRGAARWKDASDHRVPLLALTLLGLAGSWTVRTFVTQRADFTDDERLYWYQAQVLLEGMIVGPSQPVPGAFEYEFIAATHDGSGLAGIFTVGQPLLLALGSLVGDRDLFQWLAVGALVLLTFALARELFERTPLALVAAAFVALSPSLLLAAGSRHNDVPCAAFSAAALWCALRWEKTSALGWASGAGACTAAVFLIRPLDGLIALLALAAFASLRARRDGGAGRWRGVLIAGLSFAAGSAFQLYVNWRSTGRPFSPTYDLWIARDWPQAIRFGFGLGTWNVEQTPSSLLVKTFTAALRIAQWLGGNLLLAVPVFVGLLQPELRRRAGLALWWALLFVGGYAAFVFPSTHDFGSVYHLPLLPLLAIAFALGLEALATRVVRFRGLVAASVLVAASTFVAFQLRRLHRVADSVQAPLLLAQTAHERVGRPLVVLWKRMFPGKLPTSWVRMPPPLSPRRDEPIIWARDDAAALPGLRTAFPDRLFVRLGWSATGEPTLEPLEQPPSPQGVSPDGR